MLELKLKKVALVVWLFFQTTNVIAQKVDFSLVKKSLESYDYKQVKIELEKIDTTIISQFDMATWLYHLSNYYYRNDQHHTAFENIVKSQKIYRTLKNDRGIMNTYALIRDILSHQNKLKKNLLIYNDTIVKYARTLKDTLMLEKTFRNTAIYYIDQNNRSKSLQFFDSINYFAIHRKDSLKVARTTANIGVLYQVTSPVKIDSAIFFTKKACSIFIKLKNKNYLSNSYYNLGNFYKLIKNYKTATHYFKKADSIPLDKFISKTKVVFYKNMADTYFQDKQYKNAAIYFQKQIALQDSINDTKQNIAISEIQTKYETAEKEKQILLKEKENKKIKNIVILLGVSLLLGSIIAFLQYRSSNRKKRIAEKDQQLAKQKVTNLLKEQELIAIDAMIEGQEKERQLIASDLHDDLGALMATLQLNFDNLNKHKNSKDADKLFRKTKNLISEAYQKIRKMAHAKNSGVIAKQGLLKAIKNNADKISQLNNIHIDVREHGLENRLENSLELTIFRIVQELITNVIKHANATELILHLTNHEGLLNIMVEDNGKGFDVANISRSKGMGIQSIEKRVEALEGTITIESILGKGTTIILDIPI